MVHVVSASRYQKLLADLPSARRQEETGNTTKSRELAGDRQLANTG